MYTATTSLIENRSNRPTEATETTRATEATEATGGPFPLLLLLQERS
jgi:hypothetical protein